MSDNLCGLPGEPSDIAGGILGGTRRISKTEQSIREQEDNDLFTMVHDPRRQRQRQAAIDEPQKVPLVKKILAYLADKSLVETQAIHDTIIGDSWKVLLDMRSGRKK